MKKAYLFIFLILLTLVSFVLCFMKFKHQRFPVYNTMSVVINAYNLQPYDVVVKSNDKYLDVQFNKNAYLALLKKKVKTLDILVKDGVKINEPAIINDNQTNYFKDLSSLENEHLYFCFPPPPLQRK